MMKHPLTLSALALLVCASAQAATVDLRVLETTDLHSNMMDFDYYKDTPTDKFGLVRTASLIQQARQQATNAVLVDNGDIIQGSPLGDYMAAKGLKPGDVHPVYKAMNTLDYVVGNIGNHEFNYGLDYLKTPSPAPSSRISTPTSSTPKRKTAVHAVHHRRYAGERPRRQGAYAAHRLHRLRAAADPGVDKANLQGKVTVDDITATAKRYVPEMRKQGADLVVAIPHSGLSSEPYKAMAENSVYYLSQVPGIDAIMFGHAHAVFLSKDFANIKGADIDKGLLNGVPAVMPGQWGDHLGVVDLQLNNDSGSWKVTAAKAEARPIYDKENKKSLAAEDAALVKVLADDHKGTREFVSQPIGKSDGNMYSYLALVQDDPTVQIVNNAQKAYVEHYIQGDRIWPSAGAVGGGAVQGRRPQERSGQLRRSGKGPTHLPQRRRSLSLPQYPGGGEGQRQRGERVAGVLRRPVQPDRRQQRQAAGLDQLGRLPHL